MLLTLGACQPHHPLGMSVNHPSDVPLGMSVNPLSDVPLGMSVEKGQQVE